MTISLKIMEVIDSQFLPVLVISYTFFYQTIICKVNQCTPRKSVGECERCLKSNQCNKGYCCPYKKLCIDSVINKCVVENANCFPPEYKVCRENMDPYACLCGNREFPQQWAKPTCEGIQNFKVYLCTQNISHFLLQSSNEYIHIL